MGRYEEAVAEARRTVALNPGWQIAATDVLLALLYWRHYDEAFTEAQQAVTLDPNNAGARWILGQIYGQQRMYKEAIAELQRSLAIGDPNPRAPADLGYVYAVSGEKKKAVAVIAELKKTSSSLTPYLIAEVYAGLGDRDQAFAWLDKAYEDRFPFLCDFRITPQFDSLRDDPRYTALVRKMNLPH